MVITSLRWVELNGDLHVVIDSQCANLWGDSERFVVPVSSVEEKESTMAASLLKRKCAP